jgi:GNAT superfamily N-acetyltransferase
VVLGSRCIDLTTNRDLVLDLKVLTNYASDSRLARTQSLAAYSRRWYASGQPESFWNAVRESLEDARTIASIFELDGEDVAWAWVTFMEFDGHELIAAELRVIAVAPAWHRRGVGGEVLRFVEETARARGAAVLRSEARIDNEASLRMHARCGLLPTGINFEKHLTSDGRAMERDWRLASVASLRVLAEAVEDQGGDW